MAKDLFSTQAGIYAKYRPTYPAALIEYILSFVTEREAAWDCATGNGQTALLLAPYFKKIMATDVSEKQISHAIPDPVITYSVSTAEHSPFPDNSFNLITVSQAYHWFQFDAFFREATRTGKPGAVVAVWGYDLINTPDKRLDEAIHHFYTHTVGPYWDAERKYVDEKYESIPFPFRELPSKHFSIDVEWQIEDCTGYLNSWSSVQHFIKANQYNPVDELEKQLKEIWKEDEKRPFSFPLFLRIGMLGK
jgi:ubiquinone/menaquinone biosynthesis C-methylase UbiE